MYLATTPQELVVEKAFIEMDGDRDGAVTEEEFVQACLSHRYPLLLLLVLLLVILLLLHNTSPSCHNICRRFSRMLALKLIDLFTA